MPTMTVESTQVRSALGKAHVARCPRCKGLAREAMRDRLDEHEVAVRYVCPACGTRRTKRFPAPLA